MTAVGSPAGAPYAARLSVDYPDKLDRLTTLLRLVWVLPIVVLLTIIDPGSDGARTGGALVGGLWFATMLMLAVRTLYPRWWFDFARELTRFGGRVWAYMALLTDRYPSTTDEQSVHLEVDYPDVARDLNRWLPLVKWLLAVPHYISVRRRARSGRSSSVSRSCRHWRGHRGSGRGRGNRRVRKFQELGRRDPCRGMVGRHRLGRPHRHARWPAAGRSSVSNAAYSGVANGMTAQQREPNLTD